jgi:hypothetical protein
MSLILPSERRVTVVIPHDSGRRAIGFCGLCEVPFYSDRDMRGHLSGGAHADALEQARAARELQNRRLAIFNEHPDPEAEAHLLKVGRRMLREGRWTVRPNERAG